MSQSLMADALSRATDTREIALGRQVIGRVGEVFAQWVNSRRVVIVADETTFGLAGNQVHASLVEAGCEIVDVFVFPAQPPVYAGYENVTTVKSVLARNEAVACSIGSGTISDLVKLASGELGQPYVHVCTAASMDGYAAFGAAITKDGFKITRTCPAPVAIIADLDVMATAPKHMIANGYADILEKFTGGADWIIADALGIETIEPEIWNYVQANLAEIMANPGGLASGDLGLMEDFVTECMMAGLAIQAMQSSRPGSGAGHNFSHQWEMEGYGLDWPLPLSHGAKVGIGTVCIAALYDETQRRGFDHVDADAVANSWLSPEANDQRVRNLHDIPEIEEAAVVQSRGKYLEKDHVVARIELIKQVWPLIKDRLRHQVPPARQLQYMLREVGAPWHPAQIGISLDKLKHTYYQAQTIRSRYTIMDALFETGQLNSMIDSLFEPGGFWADNPMPTEGFIVPE